MIGAVTFANIQMSVCLVKNKGGEGMKRYIAVIEIDDDEEIVGDASRWEKKGFKKTGRHFLQIREVLKQMQEGNE